MKRIIIFGTAHLDSTPGKCSPDGAFREAVYSREIIADLKAIMEKQFDLERLERTRDLFIFSCFTGLAYIDVKALKPENIVNLNVAWRWRMGLLHVSW